MLAIRRFKGGKVKLQGIKETLESVTMEIRDVDKTGSKRKERSRKRTNSMKIYFQNQADWANQVTVK